MTDSPLPMESPPLFGLRDAVLVTYGRAALAHASVSLAHAEHDHASRITHRHQPEAWSPELSTGLEVLVEQYSERAFVIIGNAETVGRAAAVIECHIADLRSIIVHPAGSGHRDLVIRVRCARCGTIKSHRSDSGTTIVCSGCASPVMVTDKFSRAHLAYVGSLATEGDARRPTPPIRRRRRR